MFLLFGWCWLFPKSRKVFKKCFIHSPVADSWWSICPVLLSFYFIFPIMFICFSLKCYCCFMFCVCVFVLCVCLFFVFFEGLFKVTPWNPDFAVVHLRSSCLAIVFCPTSSSLNDMTLWHDLLLSYFILSQKVVWLSQGKSLDEDRGAGFWQTPWPVACLEDLQTCQLDSLGLNTHCIPQANLASP